MFFMSKDTERAAKRLYVRDDLDAMQSAIQHVKSAEKNAMRANDYIKAYEEKLNSPKKAEDESDNFLSFLEGEIAAFGNKIASDLSTAFWDISHIFPFYNGITGQGESEAMNGLDSDYNSDIADAFVEDHVLFIRLPMLGKRVYTSKWNRARWTLEGSLFYRDELKAALARVEKEIKWEADRTLNYVFVYDTKRVGIDSDSHDTKGITDTICSMFRGHDDCRYCSFSYDTLSTDTVPEGTYIAVTAGKSQFYDSKLTVRKWAEHWQLPR